MEKITLVEIYLIAKDNNLTAEESLSMLFSNPEKIDFSIEACIKAIILISIGEKIVQILKCKQKKSN